jgi:hypothetical protein
MKCVSAAAIAASVVFLLAGDAEAQTLEKSFPNYIWSKKPATPPFGCNYVIPLVGRTTTAYLCADQIITPDSSSNLSNKTIDCSVNNCVNFPTTSVVPAESVTMGGDEITMGGVPVTGL